MVEAAERAGAAADRARELPLAEGLPRAARRARPRHGRRPRFARISFRHGYRPLPNQPYLAEVEDFAIMDVGLHLFDVARFLLGDVERVSCETQRLNPKVRGEDAFTALLRHEGGAVASVECSFDSHHRARSVPADAGLARGRARHAGARLRLQHAGARATAKSREIDGEPAVPAWGARPWHAVQDSVAAFEAHVVDVLAGRAEPQPSGRHNLDTLALALAAYRAAARHETVDLEAFVADGCRR
jgi:D-apiose dehydrogenase